MGSSIKIVPAAILGFFIGSLALCLEIFFQQALIGGNPLLIKSYVIPIVYGGVGGIFIAILIIKRHNALTESLSFERNNNRLLQTKVDNTLSVITRLNTRLQKEVAENNQTTAALRKAKKELSKLIENDARTDILGNVLIIDDDYNYLNLLEDAFNNNEINIFTASSSDEAIQKISNKHVDLVIYNYKMQERNCASFLKYVKDDYPEISRAIIGDIEYQPSVDKIISEGLATTVFIKSGNNDVSLLEEGIIRILKLRHILSGEKVKALLANTEKSIKVPIAFTDFSDAVRKEMNFIQLAEIINKSPDVAVKFLQIFKVSFYNNNKKSSLEEIIMMLGVNAVRDIILLASLSGRGAQRSSHNEHFQKLMNHLAVVNKYLEPLSRLIYGKSIENNFKSVGLTHDIGQIILMQNFPDRFDKIISYQIRNPNLSFYDCEIALGYSDCTHSEIGAFFLYSWDFPAVNIEAALYHHNPSIARDMRHNEILRLVSFSNEIVNYLTRTANLESTNYNDFLKAIRKELY
ncbi:HDOD domain-containing protein [candidate division KSB1 bacterium]|nr:HDOD domain-containing protein [candidate division KSB1 bacterium]